MGFDFSVEFHDVVDFLDSGTHLIRILEVPLRRSHVLNCFSSSVKPLADPLQLILHLIEPKLQIVVLLLQLLQIFDLFLPLQLIEAESHTLPNFILNYFSALFHPHALDQLFEPGSGLISLLSQTVFAASLFQVRQLPAQKHFEVD